MILDNLRKAGVQNTVKNERLVFTRLEPFGSPRIQVAGEYVDADGKTRRVAVSIGPEHGTVGPQQVKEAAKEAAAAELAESVQRLKPLALAIRLGATETPTDVPIIEACIIRQLDHLQKLYTAGATPADVLHVARALKSAWAGFRSAITAKNVVDHFETYRTAPTPPPAKPYRPWEGMNLQQVKPPPRDYSPQATEEATA